MSHFRTLHWERKAVMVGMVRIELIKRGEQRGGHGDSGMVRWQRKCVGVWGGALALPSLLPNTDGQACEAQVRRGGGVVRGRGRI